MPESFIEKMWYDLVISSELYRDMCGPAYPWTVAEWEEKSARMVRDAQPWNRLRRWFWTAVWTLRHDVAKRIYDFDESDDD